MLCHDLEIDGTILKQCGMDGLAATRAYRKAILQELQRLRGYVSERKWDGTRVLAINEDGTIILQNRNGVIYTIRLPEIVKALQEHGGRWKLDGEVVYLNGNGEEEFTPAQRRCATHYPDPILRSQIPVTLEVFDILEADGINIEREPYSERKDCLLEAFFADEDGLLQEDPTSRIQYVQYETDLQLAWRETIRKNREGLILKKSDSAYEHERSYSWLKAKNWRFEGCDVVGYTQGKNSRASFFGSLVIAREGKLRGCVGSGFNDWELRRTKDHLTDCPSMDKPFSDEQVGEPYKAIKTKLQVLAKYYQTTENNMLRFPIFISSSSYP